MTINFHDTNNKQSYTTRTADNSWQDILKKMIDTQHIHHAVDIGCGGGIYSKALADMEIPAVTGVDYSEAMIDGASVNCGDYKQINFQIGNAYDTDLPDKSYDLVVERALIHHLDDLSACFTEAFRVLKNKGAIIIQDRTPSDCLLKGSGNHIRGYFFSKFPRLVGTEVKRRHSGDSVIKDLEAAGFTDIAEVKLWETRNSYPSKEELLADIRSRNGRSILHEITDHELEQLVNYIDNELNESTQIIEKDRWTIWKATKK